MTQDSLLLADGLDDAFLGIGYQFNKAFAVYDQDKVISILMERDGMSLEDAREFFEFNIGGAYVGEYTPIFLVKGPLP
jgi:hypothetical protein